MTPDPFDWNGPAFLILYVVLIVGAVISSMVIAAQRRPEGSARGTDDADSLAYLAGGAVRFGDALVARLLARGALVMTTAKTFSVRMRESGTTAAERAVLALHAPIGWSTIASTLKGHDEPLTRDMERRGLLMSPGDAATLRWWTALPFIGIFGIGAIKLAVGLSRDKPVGFLTIFLIVAAVAILITLFSGDRRTQGGIRAVSDAREKQRRLKVAPTRAETGLAVALFGTGVLAASGFADFHKLRQSSGDSGSSGSSDGSSDGGGGCGGCGGD